MYSSLNLYLNLFCLIIPIVSAQNCNGNSQLCSQSYSDVTFLGSHDASFYVLSGDEPSDNQDIDVTSQLNLGIRFLQAQTHKNVLGQLSLCHTSCYLLDAGTLKSYLSTVKAFLDANSDEVVTLLLVNGDSLPISDFAPAFTGSGIDSYAFTSPPATGSRWPTLGDLISAGTRLIVFMDTGADTTKVPYILDEFTYYFETPYDITDSSHLTTDCSLNRPAGLTSPNGRMYILNHFLDDDIFSIDVPDKADARTTNSLSSITTQVDLCKSEYNMPVWGGAVLLDWVDIGDAIAAQKEINGL